MDDAPKATPFALIVDDNPVILLHVADMLEDAGFSTFPVGDADTALDCLGERAGTIALLFANVNIPGRMNGFALARYAAERWPSMGIVVSSGDTTPASSSLPDGAVFVAKPFTLSQLAQAVIEIFSSKNIEPPRALSTV